MSTHTSTDGRHWDYSRPAFALSTPRERYVILNSGDITRPSIGLKASGKWKALALVRRNNFGNVVEVITFDRWSTVADGKRDMVRKNGKPIWRVRDLDHGTQREWGEGVISLRTV